MAFYVALPLWSSPLHSSPPLSHVPSCAELELHSRKLSVRFGRKNSCGEGHVGPASAVWRARYGLSQSDYSQGLPGNMTTSGHFKSQKHWNGAGMIVLQPSDRTKARREDGPQGSPDEQREKKMSEQGTPDDLEKGLQDKSAEDLAKSKRETTARQWFRPTTSIKGETKANDPKQNVGGLKEFGQGGKNAEGKRQDERVGAGSQENWDEREDSRQEDKVPSARAQKEESQFGFWRRFWKQGKNIDDDVRNPDIDLLLRDLENLTFQWKDLFDPTLENVLALGLTALLILALGKIIWQILLVVVTIILAALKYTVVAAFLVGLLVFLL